MAYDTFLAERIARELDQLGTIYTEKKMFGGVAFMVDEKMCIGVHEDRLMARIDPEIEEDALKRKGASPMDFTGRKMKGFIFVSPVGYDFDDDLSGWIQLCLEYNPKAKASKKKKKTNKK